MSSRISLDQVAKGKTYQVIGFQHSESAYAEKLYKMGFVEGTTLQLAPVALKDPIVIEIRGGRIVITSYSIHYTKLYELEEFHGYLNVIIREAYRCKGIIDSLLSFSRKSEGAVDSVNVNRLMEEVLELVRHKARYDIV